MFNKNLRLKIFFFTFLFCSFFTTQICDAQIIYNTYMDNNQNMIQNIAPTSDTGQNTGKPIYLPDVGYLPTSI